MVTLWRSNEHELRTGDVPPVSRLDWVMAGVFGAITLLEGTGRPDVTWRPVVLAATLSLIPALVWRRAHPLAATMFGWGLAGVLAVLQLIADTRELGLDAMMVVLIVLYALARWGSERQVVIGMTFVTVVVALGMYAATADLTEVLGGSALVLLVVALAVVFRFRADLWRRQQRHIRNQERVALARELHDSVAHHVSAIAVQAQAGGVIAGVEPERAAAVLATIEAEASRTLTEMRSVVRLLREDDDAGYPPQLGAADLPALARTDTTPTVTVSVHGSSPRLARPVDAALFRLAQESVTNATRHARSATHVAIDVRRVGDRVRLRVSDDGRIEAGPAAEPGFGLVGMAERVERIGGSFYAGPGPGGGWLVEAELPLEPSA